MKQSDPVSLSRPADATRGDRHLRHTRQSRATKSRTSNACEACKRRKTKCSGGPSPCQICKRADTFCNFNPKLDTRRKVSYSSTTVQDRQQFMLTGLLQTIKHIPEEDLQHLISLIRDSSRIDSVATCLRSHFSTLQARGTIPAYDIDDTDVISFGLQGLCGHRKGRPRPISPTSNIEPDPSEARSPTAWSMDSSASNMDPIKEECSADSLSIEDDDLFDHAGDFGSSDVFNDPFNNELMSNQQNNLIPFDESSSYPQHLNSGSDSSMAPLYAPDVTMEHSRTLPQALAAFPPSHLQQLHQYYHQIQPHPQSAPGHELHAMQFHHPKSPDSLPRTIDPHLAMKACNQARVLQYGANATDTLGDFSHANYTFQPLRSNA